MSNCNQTTLHGIQYAAAVPARPTEQGCRADPNRLADLRQRLFEMIVQNEARRRSRSAARALQARFATS